MQLKFLAADCKAKIIHNYCILL